MRKISNFDKKFLESLFRYTDVELLHFCQSFLNSLYDKVISTEDYVVAVGDIPVALIAHLDTVFSAPPKEIYYDEYQGIMWSPQGLGADDRAGVYSIFKILESGLRPHVIFTTDEEIGGLGALQLIHDYPQYPFKELNFIIELDRCNTNDCVFYECINQEFVEYWERLGFCETIGIYSDIYEICPQWGIAGVNLSVGYRNEHSAIETLKVPAMLQTIDKVKYILSNSKLYNQKFEWKGFPGFMDWFKKHKNTIYSDEFNFSY